MKSIGGICLSIAAAMSLAQEGDRAVWDAIAPYEKAIRGVEGVLDISVGQVKGDRGVLVRVRTKEASDTLQVLFHGRVGDFPLQVYLGTVAAPPPGETCLHCPIHCGGAPPATPPARSAPGVTKVDTTRLDDPAYAQERCDVIRKWLGLPRLEEGDVRCREMVSTTNNPARIKWAIAQGFPHWRSQDLPTARGSDSSGVACPEHGSHNAGEMVCYTWIKHRQFCPLGAKQVLKEIEDMSPNQGPRK